MNQSRLKRNAAGAAPTATGGHSERQPFPQPHYIIPLPIVQERIDVSCPRRSAGLPHRFDHRSPNPEDQWSAYSGTPGHEPGKLVTCQWNQGGDV